MTTPTSKPFAVAARRCAAAGHPLRGAVVAIGNFDGVHRGHRAVIATALERARALGRPAAALTFEPHPRSFFRPQEPLFRLTDERNKLRLLAATGLDGAIVLRFDAALAALSAEEFVERHPGRPARGRGRGDRLRFPFRRQPHGLARLPRRRRARGTAFAVDIVPRFEDKGRRISSGSDPRRAAAGHVAEAAEMLGYPWFVSGEVVHGDKRGRELGYPTANLRLDPACGLRHGIYAVRVGVGGAPL